MLKDTSWLQAKKEWQDAIAEAKKKREAKETEDAEEAGPGKMEGPEKALADATKKLSSQLGDTPGMLGRQADKMQTFGTFNRPPWIESSPLAVSPPKPGSKRLFTKWPLLLRHKAEILTGLSRGLNIL